MSPSDTATDEYKKYFPEYAKDAQDPQEITKLIVELKQKDMTGKVFVVRDSAVSKGLYK